MKKLLALAIVALIIFALPAAALADETVLSDGFEGVSSGLPESWYTESWLTGEDEFSVYMTEGYTGEGVAIDNPVENDTRLCRTFGVESGTYYRISCYISTQGVTGGAGANISLPDSLVTSDGIYGDSEWQYAELVGKTGKEQSELRICVRVGGYSATSYGTAIFDDIKIEKLDTEPSGDIKDFSYEKTSTDDAQKPQGKSFGASVILPALTFILFMCVAWRFIRREDMETDLCDKRASSVWPVLIAAFILRTIIALLVMGHPTDIYCFMAWGEALYDKGFSTFYTSGMFADYTPGYMYVLWLTGALSRLFGFSYGTMGCAIITKLPAITADVLAAYLVYRLSAKKLPQRTSIVLSLLVALSPVMSFVSAGWGQIDQILALLLIVSALLFIDKKLILAGLVYGLAVLVKPQALMVGPLMATAYITMIIDERGSLVAILKTVAAAVGALLLIWLLSLPFQGTQEPLWLLERYFNTATSYPYASVEAYNLFALFGGNWASVNDTFLIFSYGEWGTVLMALSVIFAGVMYVFGRKREPNCLMLLSGWLLMALFMLGQYMHERYMFPVLLLVLIAFIAYRDRRLMTVFLALSSTLLLNVLGAYNIMLDQSARYTGYNVLVYMGAVLNIAAFSYFTYTCCDIVFNGRIILPEKRPVPDGNDTRRLLPAKYSPARFTKKDRLYCIALTALYAVIALVNLGTLQAPQTAWTGSAGDEARIEFAQGETGVSDIRVFGGLYTGSITLTLDDGTVVDYTEDNGDMFRWHSIWGESASSAGAVIRVDFGEVWFNEIAFFDENGEYISASSDAAALTDEPEQVPKVDSFLNGMYFDELYHARTAYEHLNGIKPYENSHPPLGKVFIMLGIALFGMNAFGWRIIGTLFGIGMVPLMYLFAKRLFKKSEYALLAAVLFAFDFMHYTQTRIATIDVYGVFFIILMFYFMHQYFSRNFFTDGLFATLKPLAWGGVFFGLGAASKWICLYAGAGMAVLLFTSLVTRATEYHRLKNSEDERVSAAVAPFYKYLIITLLWCVLFYIVIPVGVYLLSYIPYYLCESSYDLAGVWDVQKFMFKYHSTLTATHPYQSTWWQWVLDIRPMWYYVGYNVAEGNISTISAMGNPVVWLGCLVGTVALAVMLIRRKIVFDGSKYVLFIGIAANLVPWMFVTRCTFIYHYFATVPFIILCSVYAVRYLEKLSEKYRAVKWVWMGAAVLLFALFYPVISGLECPKAYVKLLEWLPTWTFLGY